MWLAHPGGRRNRDLCSDRAWRIDVCGALCDMQAAADAKGKKGGKSKGGKGRKDGKGKGGK